jgi:hypothetical protein
MLGVLLMNLWSRLNYISLICIYFSLISLR